MGLVEYMGKKSKKSEKESDSAPRIEYFAMIELSCGCKDINLRSSKDGYSCKNCSRIITQSLITDLYETPDDLVGCLASSMIQGSVNLFGSRKKYKVIPRCSDSDPMEELRSLKTVEGERYSLEEDRDALRKKVEDRDSEISELKSAIEDLRKNNCELSENLQKSQAHSESLHNTLQKLQGDRTELQSRMAELQSRIDGLQKRNAELQSRNSTLSSRLNSRERDLDETLRRRSAELKAKDSVQVRAVVSDFLKYIGYVNNMLEDNQSFDRGFYDAISDDLRKHLSAHGVELLWHKRGHQLVDEQLYEPIFVSTNQQSLDMCVKRVEGIGCRFKDGAYDDVPERLSIHRYDPGADSSLGATGAGETVDTDVQEADGSRDTGSRESDEQDGSEEAGPVQENDAPLPDVIESHTADVSSLESEEAAADDQSGGIRNPEPAVDIDVSEPPVIPAPLVSEDQERDASPAEEVGAAPQDGSEATALESVEQKDPVADGQSDGIPESEPIIDNDVPKSPSIPEASMPGRDECEVPAQEGEHEAHLDEPESAVVESAIQEETMADDQPGEIRDPESFANVPQEPLPQERQENGKPSAGGDDSVTEDGSEDE